MRRSKRYIDKAAVEKALFDVLYVCDGTPVGQSVRDIVRKAGTTLQSFDSKDRAYAKRLLEAMRKRGEIDGVVADLGQQRYDRKTGTMKVVRWVATAMYWRTK